MNEEKLMLVLKREEVETAFSTFHLDTGHVVQLHKTTNITKVVESTFDMSV